MIGKFLRTIGLGIFVENASTAFDAANKLNTSRHFIINAPGAIAMILEEPEYFDIDKKQIDNISNFSNRRNYLIALRCLLNEQICYYICSASLGNRFVLQENIDGMFVDVVRI
jgi:hypothetical protein